MLSLGFGSGAPALSADSILLGLYPAGSLATPGVVDTIAAVDAWLAPTRKRVTIAGTAMVVENDPKTVPAELEAAWHRGYLPYVALFSTHKTTDIANGVVDGPVRAWAAQLALWASNGQQRPATGLRRPVHRR